MNQGKYDSSVQEQKQGKSQLKHLKTKGKSKLGSRIRLGNVVLFFEEINQKLLDWEIEEHIEHIFYSASIQLWNMVFESKVAPPFEKQDPRFMKIPSDVQTPNYEELLKLNEFVKQGLLTLYQEMPLDFIDALED